MRAAPSVDADVADVVLPTDRTLSGEGRAVCAMTFRDDQPVETLDEALVWLRCTRGTISVLAVSVYEAGPEEPYLLWSTPQANVVWDDVVEVQIRPGQDCVLVVRFRWTQDPSAASTVGFRRTEYTFELVPSGTCSA